MADETFVTEVVVDLDLKRAQAQIAALSKRLHGAVNSAALGPLSGVTGGRRGAIGTTAIARRKANADLALARDTETAANRMARAASALSFITRPGGLATFGRNVRRGFDSASSNTRAASLIGGAAGLGALYSYGRFQTQSIGLAAPIVSASKDKIGFKEALGLSRDKYIPALDKFAAQTPFTLGGDIIPAARTGMNFGLQQANTPESVTEMVRMLGNMQVATGNRRTMDDLAVILGKGASRGKFEGEEMLQLAEAGINIGEIMREIGGKELKNFKKGGLAGVYGTDSDKMLKAIRTIYTDSNRKGGLVKELSTTLPGAVSTFQDAVDRFGRRAGKAAEDQYNISGEILSWADSLNNAPDWLIKEFGLLAGITATVSTGLKAFGVSLQGIIGVIAGSLAVGAFARAAGVSPWTGGIRSKKRYNRTMSRGGAMGYLGRAGVYGLQGFRGMGAAGIGGYLGYRAAEEMGYGETGRWVGTGVGMAAGAGGLLWSERNRANDGPFRKGVSSLITGVGKVTGGLSLVAGAAYGAAAAISLLDSDAERHFQAGKGLHWYDDLALSIQRLVGGGNDGFDYGGNLRGNGKLTVEVLDQRVIAKYSDEKTNELVGIPMNGGGYRGALVQ